MSVIAGLWYSGSFHQLGAQALGIAAAFGSIFIASYAIFGLIKATIGLRVTEEEEDAGLDISEHGMYGYPEAFIPAEEFTTGGTVPQPVSAPAVTTMAADRPSEA